jgi:hypothetical protein
VTARPVCDNSNVIQFRRLATLLLGAWLGAGAFADFAVTQNFQTVDRFLEAPGTPSASQELNAFGRSREREILRRNAAEENNFLFTNWERFEIVLGAALLAALFFGERPTPGRLTAALAMWLIVGVQHFWFSPTVAGLGRQIDGLPADAPLVKTFWMYHGFYSGSEILKLLVGLGLAVRLSLRSKPDPNMFVKEFEAARLSGTKARAGARA